MVRFRFNFNYVPIHKHSTHGSGSIFAGRLFLRQRRQFLSMYHRPFLNLAHGPPQQLAVDDFECAEVDGRFERSLKYIRIKIP